MNNARVHYQCQRCGNCCRWPGEVRVSESEIQEMAKLLGMSADAFRERFTTLRRDRQGLTLIEKPNRECVFLEGIECRVHPVKPDQCRGFPNRWNFPGWRQVCEAIAVPMGSGVAKEPAEG